MTPPRNNVKKILFILLLGVLMPMGAWAQSMVYLEEAERLSYDANLRQGAQVLHGHVRFRHEDALMYCDSAYFYEGINSLDAFGHVRFVQGDTLFGFCDVLHYDGNTKLAEMQHRVKLVDKQTQLTTDALNFDRITNRAWYWTGGTIQDSLNTLTSGYGDYFTRDHQAHFRDNVRLENNRFTMDADTMDYNTETHIADIYGPTEIVYEEETNIYSTLGHYNTETEQSTLLQRSRVVHKDGKTLTGDSIYYDKRIGYGQGLGQVEMVDSTRKISLYGNYCELYEKSETQGSRGLATDSALMIDWSDSTTYTYMHADTLRQTEILYRDTVLEVDTSYQIVRGYHHARVYREDMQAVCDSAVFISRDSILMLYHQPILWQEDEQIVADYIEVFFRDSTLDHAHGQGNCLVSRQQTDEYFDQMYGKEMTAWVKDNELYLVEVSGNAETVFFPRDEETDEIVGVNKTQSSFVKVYLENKNIERVVFTSSTTGTMYPLDQISVEETQLEAFFWADEERPKKPGDVFEHPERQRTRPRKALEEPNANNSIITQ